MFDLKERAIVVTGGTGVLGREIVRALSGAGANVVILTRHPEKAQQLDLIDERTIALAADVLDKASLARAAEEIAKRFGGVFGLVNGAGGNKPDATTKPGLSFFDLPVDALRAVFDLNLTGTILPCQVFGKMMAEKGKGVILNISSMNAFRPLTRIPAYSSAKASVNNFTQWLAVHMAQEYSPHIRVNAIAPGFFRTEQNRFLLTDEKTGELTSRGKAILAHTPIGRFGEPRDLIGTVLWLLSDASEFVTGVVVPIDGGFSAYSGV